METVLGFLRGRYTRQGTEEAARPFQEVRKLLGKGSTLVEPLSNAFIIWMVKQKRRGCCKKVGCGGWAKAFRVSSSILPTSHTDIVQVLNSGLSDQNEDDDKGFRV